MDSLSGGCRLCLDPCAECFTTIENPQLKDQMDKVFCFTIELKQGYCSGVCPSCLFAISEFYHFSEKVRQNQEILNGNVTNCDPTPDVKISLDSVNVKAFVCSRIRETTEDAGEPMDEVSADEVPILDPQITVEDIKLETINDSGESESTVKNASDSKDKVSEEEEIPSSGDDESYEQLSNNSHTNREPNKEDQLFNKHFHMICALCGTSAKTFTALNYHYKKTHKRRGYVTCCNGCNKKLTSPGAIRDHIDWHANPDLFRCEVCGKKHNTRDTLKAHMLRMHSNDDRNSVKCDHCPLSFVQKSAFVQHMEWHKNIKTKTMLPGTIEDAGDVQDTVSGVGINSTADSEITIENVKVETISDSGLLETTNAYESKNVILGEEDPTFKSEIPTKHAKVETHSDSELPERTEDAWEPENEVSEEYGIPSSDEDESYEPSLKNSHTKLKGRLRKAGNRKKKFKPTKQELYQEDQLFNKYFRMTCELCGTLTATFTELLSHFWREHKVRHGYVMCCNKKLFKRYSIREHIEFHTNPEVFRCKECGADFKNKDSLNKHMLLRHPSAGSFRCDFCPQSFAEKSALAFHIRRHVNVSCPKCNETFYSNDDFGRHMTDCGQFTCDTCGTEFTSNRSFDRHMDEHRIQRFKCNLCHCWMKSEQRLQKHMDTVHVEGNRQFQCDICLQYYPRAKALYQHKLLTHTEAQLECEICGKKLKTNRSLKDHRAIHTGEMKSRRRRASKLE